MNSGCSNFGIESTHDTWVLYSGMSFHTTSQLDILENHVVGNHGKVYLADGEPLDVIGIGDMNVKLANSSVWKNCNVHHISKYDEKLNFCRTVRQGRM